MTQPQIPSDDLHAATQPQSGTMASLAAVMRHEGEPESVLPEPENLAPMIADATGAPHATPGEAAGLPESVGAPVAPPPSAPAHAPARPRTGAWMLLAALLGAVFGGVFGGAAAMLLHFALPAVPVVDTGLTDRLAMLDKGLAASVPLSSLMESNRHIVELDGRLAVTEKTAAAALTRAQTASAAAGQGADHLKTLQAQLEALNAGLQAQRAAVPAATPLPQGEPAVLAAATPPAAIQVDLAPLEARIAQLEAGLAATVAANAAEAAKTEAARLAEAARLNDAKADIAKTQARIEVERPPVPPPAAQNAAALAVVAQALLQDLERPSGYAAELAAAETLGAGAEAVAALKPFATTGLPSLRALASAFATQVQPAPASPPAPPAPHAAPGVLDQLLASSARLVRITPPPAAQSAAAVAAAGIAALLAQDDVLGALAVWEKLPEPLQQQSSNFAASVRARLLAQAAARDLLASAIANLARPKS